MKADSPESSGRRLVIDCQVFQAPESWHRGIGKYCLELLANTVPLLPYDDIVLLLSTELPFEAEVGRALAERVPGVTRAACALRNNRVHDTAEAQVENSRLLDEFLSARGWTGCDFLVLALFPGWGPVSVLPSAAARTFVLMYDVIPLQYFRQYLDSPDLRSIYLPRFASIFDADLLLTISQSAADDLRLHVGVPAERIANIGGAAIPRRQDDFRRPDGVPDQPFVLLPSAPDFRKNNARAVDAFERFRKHHHLDTRLVLPSSYSDQEKFALSRFSDAPVFVGSVSEAEMGWLFSHAEAVLFASESEGLGLPVLEGVAAGKPVICSDIAPFREISQDALYLFDPFDTDSIADALDRALVRERHVFSERAIAYEEITQRYAWSVTAERLRDALTGPVPARVPTAQKPRIAVVGPDPAGGSPVGRFLQHIHGELAERLSIDYYLEPPVGQRPARRLSFLPQVAPVRNVASFDASTHATYDAVVYHVARGPQHVRTLDLALHLPGCVVLHDTALRPMFGRLTAVGAMTGTRAAAERELDRALGVRAGTGLVSLVNRQRAVVVHSEAAHAAVAEAALTDVAVHVLRPPVAVPDVPARGDRRPRRIGVVAAAAEREDLLKLVRDPLLAPFRWTVHLAGSPGGGDAEFTDERVDIVSAPTDFEWQRFLARADVLVHLPSSAGTPVAATLTITEAMRYGTVNVTVGFGSRPPGFPSNSVVEVAGLDELPIELVGLLDDADGRCARARAAQAEVRRSCSPAGYAAALGEVIAGA